MSAPRYPIQADCPIYFMQDPGEIGSDVLPLEYASERLEKDERPATILNSLKIPSNFVQFATAREKHRTRHEDKVRIGRITRRVATATGQALAKAGGNAFGG